MTFFGEVVYPQGDLLDDDDFSVPDGSEDEANRDRYEIKFSDEFPAKFSKKVVNQLIIAVNKAPCAFLSAYLAPAGSNERNLLDVYENAGGRDDATVYSVTGKRPCCTLKYFYAEKYDSLLVACPKEVYDGICYEIVEKLYDLCKFQSVFLLDYKSSAMDYIGDRKNSIDDDEFKAFLRQFRTYHETAANSLPDVKRLEAPNVLNGISAAIISFCEIRNLPAMALIAYGRSARISSEDVHLFKCLANLPNFGDLVKKNEQEAIQMVRSLLDNQSSVYI